MKINFGLFSKKELDQAEQYIINNDVDDLITDYGNEYLKEILVLHYKEHISIRKMSDTNIIPYSFGTISKIIIDFKKYILYKRRL